jgi:hypothetical protein
LGMSDAFRTLLRVRGVRFDTPTPVDGQTREKAAEKLLTRVVRKCVDEANRHRDPEG